LELWDAYDEDENLMGRDLLRDEPVPKGLYHLVVTILVRHVDGEYLLMQRDFSKKSYPGYLEATAGGSVLKGETPIEAATREVNEETGLSIFGLQLLDKVKYDYGDIYYCYWAKTADDKNSVTLQQGETIDFKWVNENQLLEFTDSENCIPIVRERLKRYIFQIKG